MRDKATAKKTFVGYAFDNEPIDTIANIIKSSIHFSYPSFMKSIRMKRTKHVCVTITIEVEETGWPQHRPRNMPRFPSPE